MIFNIFCYRLVLITSVPTVAQCYKIIYIMTTAMSAREPRPQRTTSGYSTTQHTFITHPTTTKTTTTAKDEPVDIIYLYEDHIGNIQKSYGVLPVNELVTDRANCRVRDLILKEDRSYGVYVVVNVALLGFTQCQ